MITMTKYTFYILLTVLLTVYGQIVIKWKMLNVGKLPDDIITKVLFLFMNIFNPWIASAFIGAFVSAILWMYAMTKVDLSYAYPFMSLSFVFVLFLSHYFFKETITIYKIYGMLLIVAGVIISARA